LRNDITEFESKAKNLRPFHFIVVCWGEAHTDFLLNYCIAALLSPRNIPSLKNNNKNKFLIATTKLDWDLMQFRPMFQKLKEYVEPVYIEIPPLPVGQSHCVHMGIGHKLATQYAYEAKAYSILLTPDLMVSDGTMEEIQKHAVNGIEVVLVAALRFAQEPLFENLKKLGIVPNSKILGEKKESLDLNPRLLVKAGLKSFHSETIRYDFESKCFSGFPVACWWKCEDKDEAIIVHSLSWAPLLVDYAAVPSHDSSMMDNWTIDGDYVYKNFGMSEKIYVVTDSDECMLVSWTPWNVGSLPLKPLWRYFYPPIEKFIKLVLINSTVNDKVFDPLKRKIFRYPVYWHANEVNESIEKVASKSCQLIETGTSADFQTLVKELNLRLENTIGIVDMNSHSLIKIFEYIDKVTLSKKTSNKIVYLLLITNKKLNYCSILVFEMSIRILSYIFKSIRYIKSKVLYSFLGIKLFLLLFINDEEAKFKIKKKLKIIRSYINKK